MRRFLFVIILLFASILLTGCNNEKAVVAFSKTPFKTDSTYNLTTTFSKGEKIYYAIYNPNGFKTRLLKFQVFKKESEKSEFWGLEYLYNRTIELKNKTTYADYVVINNAGFYIFQFFDYTDFQQPVALGIIKVE